MEKQCLECEKKLLPGRSDKKFCDVKCKSAYHNRNRFYVEVPNGRAIDNKLHSNRNILKAFYPSSNGTEWIKLKPLLISGFETRVYHGIETSKKQEIGYILYDYAYRMDKENNLIRIYYDRTGFHHF